MATVKQLELKLTRANTKIQKLSDELKEVRALKKTIQADLKSEKLAEKEAKVSNKPKSKSAKSRKK